MFDKGRLWKKNNVYVKIVLKWGFLPKKIITKCSKTRRVEKE